MGSYCSIHNDHPEDTVLVYVGVNPHVLQPVLWSITGVSAALSGGVWMGALPEVLGATTMATAAVSVRTLTTCAGTVVSATQAVVDKYQTQVVHDLTQGGYTKLLPGQSYTTRRLTLALNLRAWVVRIRQTPTALILQRSDASVWSGASPGSINVYRVMDGKVFQKYNHESIPLLVAASGEMLEPLQSQQSITPPTTQRVEGTVSNKRLASTAKKGVNNLSYPWDEEDADTCIVHIEDYVQRSHLDQATGENSANDQNDDCTLDADEEQYTLLQPGIEQCECTEIREEEDQQDDNNNSTSSWMQVDRVQASDAPNAPSTTVSDINSSEKKLLDLPSSDKLMPSQTAITNMTSMRQKCQARFPLLYPGTQTQ